MISRRFILSAGLSALSVGAALPLSVEAQTVSGPRPRLRPVTANTPGPQGLAATIRAAGLDGDVVCAVAEAGTGRVLEDLGGDEGLPPASVAKALTALYALDVLGAGHRFTTKVLATGPLVGGVLQGDLILAGGGDPTLDSTNLAALVDRLKEQGVQRVTGRFLVWEDALPYVASIDPGQPDHLGYSPAVSGLALNFNRVHFEWKRAGQSWNITMQARTERYRPDVSMAKMQIVNRSTPVFSYLNERGLDSWSVARTALGQNGARWLPVRRPGLYAADVFQTLARAQGIVLKAPEFIPALPDAAVLAQHLSDPLPVLLKDMLKYSNNLMAEMIGMSATRKLGVSFNSLAGSARQMNEWARVKYGMTNCDLVDHSGLGEKSRITAKDLVRALVVAHRDGVLKPLLKPFVLKDSSGRPVKTHPVKVAAKTGTLNFVSGLGGFITAADGTEMVFAIFTANFDLRAGIARSERERPRGSRSWNTRAKRLQQALIERWAGVYSS